jgi:subtilisin family serine protease
MLNRATVVLSAVVALSACAGTLADVGLPSAPRHPTQILVRFERTADAAAVQALKERAGVTATLVEYPLVPGLACLQVREGEVDKVLATLSGDPLVRYAEPDYVRSVDVQNTPYGITMVRAPQAWAAGGGTGAARGAGARVAVLDTGVAFGHPDLPVPVLSETFIAGQAVDDLHSHGTHCSGTVLALDNDEGVIGVAPEAQLMIGKVLGNSGSGSDGSVLAGVNWAVANGADVISMSLGGSGFSQAFADSVIAANNAGVTVVAAAGNSASSNPSYPASYPGVISVSAIDSNQSLASFSNFGPLISMAAPGVGVESTIPAIVTRVTWDNVARSSNRLTGSAVGEVAGQAIYCGLGGSAEDFPASVAGNIAHVRRGGGISFQVKAQNALDAGAIGVVVSNNVSGNFTGTLNQSFPFPVVTLSQSDGNLLEAANGVQTSIGTTQTGFTYASFNGTSMACPHVSGVAALLYAVPGNHTAAQIRTAMEVTATDLGAPGRDDQFGNGLVNAEAARAFLVALPLACNLADITQVGGTGELIGMPDGQLTVDDVIVFVNLFSDGSGCPIGIGTASCSPADVTGVGGPPAGPDGQLTVDDVIAFINSFSDGCV